MCIPSNQPTATHPRSMPRPRKSSANEATGMGVRTSRSGARAASASEAGAGTGTAMAAMSNVWGDWMSEEMTAAPPSSTAAAAVDVPANEADKEPADAKPASSTTAAAPTTAASGPRAYVLPLKPRSADTTPGLLLQTGTLDASIPGRGSVGKVPRAVDLECPTRLFPGILGMKFVSVVSSPTACHSVGITQEAVQTNHVHSTFPYHQDGRAYGWGRNESGQIGLGYSSPCVPVPTLLSIDASKTGNSDVRFVSAGVGKHHTLLVTEDGAVFASGGNKCGQLGINNEKLEACDRFRKCVVVDYGVEEEDAVKIVHASCGENISALLSSTGHLYTAGSSEFGQLGNGETGEYIIAAGKLGYANCPKFLRRDLFVQSEAEDKGGMPPTSLDAKGKVKCVSLRDSSSICLATVSCGKNHVIAVEAPSSNGEIPRVFSWGCGDYGCLGHVVQADEYTPRLLSSFRGPMFTNNPPVEAVAGSNCSLVRTKNGHVYYMGKHRSVGEATMRPTLIDALANNGHVVTAIGAGSQTVFCSTANGVTVSWGHGNHGELGYGKGENKSSAKPKFVNGLDSCLITSLVCGMGHTLFLIRDEDAEDAKAIKKLPKLEEADVAQFVEQMKSKKGGDAGDEPPKKKQRGKGKKS
ncbi:hypothetical protein HJC23_003151 [Cyclotella cryptica]|uniref:Regulator of chromosome condensation n=1 Tax=Cyclotella cryptica TaxID=29204 RepID=A0ABD3NK62_9STRA